MNKRPLRWAFFSYAHNLGDFTRASEIAKGMKVSGAVVKFFNHGGIHADKAESMGIDSIILKPTISQKQHEIIMAINHNGTHVLTGVTGILPDFCL